MTKKPSVKTTIRTRLLQLQTLFNTPLPTELMFTRTLQGCSAQIGEATRNKKPVLLISIDVALPMSAALDALFHEYAHAMSWGWEDEEHGGHWGLCMAAIWEWYTES